MEIHNRGASEVSLDGLFLSDDPAEPSRWPLPAFVIPPGGRLLVWCDGQPEQGPLHASFRLDREGESAGIYEVDDGLVRIADFIRFGPQEPDVAIGRFPDGAPGPVRLPCPTPGAPNRADCAGDDPFIRGDLASDGSLDLSDPLAILGGLFLGSGIPCPDAADVDDDGRIDLADPIALLAHLFLGGTAPPAPGPADCGQDPTADGLPPCDGGECGTAAGR